MKCLGPWQVKCQGHILFIPVVNFSMHFYGDRPKSLQMTYLHVTTMSIKQTKKYKKILCTVVLKRVTARKYVENSK